MAGYSTYVSPIDRMGAIASVGGQVQQQQITRNEAPLRQGILRQTSEINDQVIQQNKNVATDRETGIQNDQNQAKVDQRLQEDQSIASNSYALMQLPDEQMISQTSQIYPDIIREMQENGGTPEQLRSMLKFNVDRSEFLRAGAAGTSRGNPPADIQTYEYVKSLSNEDRDLFEKIQRGDQLTPEEEAKAAGLKQDAVEASKTKAMIERAKDPNTPEGRDALKAKSAEKKLARTKRADLFKLEDTLKVANKIKENVGDLNTGFSQMVLKMFPGTKNFDFEALTNSLKNKIALDTMLQLKANSPTGSTGFGQLSEKELKLLENNIAQLATSQTENQFRDNIGIVIQHYERLAGLLKLEYLEDKEPPATTLAGRIKQMESVGITNDETQRQVLSYEGLGGEDSQPDVSGIQQGTTVYQNGVGYIFNGGNPSDPVNYTEVQ